MVSTVGKSVDKGAKWGLAGMAAGGVAGLAALGGAAYGLFALGSMWVGAMAAATTTAGAIAIGVGGVAGTIAAVGAAVVTVPLVAAVLTPVVLSVGGLAAGLGIVSGAKEAHRENAHQQAELNFNKGYQDQVAQVSAALAQQSQPQAPVYAAQPAAQKTATARADVPTMMAGNIEHQGHVVNAELAAAR